jgi:nucleoside-diphosphate-sugar epimerase
MANVLIVGGAGYVGGAITDLLQASNNSVRVYDKLLYEDSYRKDVPFFYGDVRDIDKLKVQLQWADTVVWLAALVGDGACSINPELTVEINQQSVEWLSKNFDGRIIFMSTCSVYGAQTEVLTEESAANPLSIYAATKYKAETYLKNKNAIIFRLGTLFGVGDQYSRIRMDLVVNVLTAKAYSQGKMNVFGGEQFRPLLHVSDVAQAVIQNLDTKHTGVYNLCKQNVRIVDLAYQIRNHFSDCRIETTDIPFQDTRNYKVSCEKAKRDFDFKPTYSIDDGVEQLKFLIETGRIKNLNDPRYSNQLFLTENISIL